MLIHLFKKIVDAKKQIEILLGDEEVFSSLSELQTELGRRLAWIKNPSFAKTSRVPSSNETLSIQENQALDQLLTDKTQVEEMFKNVFALEQAKKYEFITNENRKQYIRPTVRFGLDFAFCEELMPLVKSFVDGLVQADKNGTLPLFFSKVEPLMLSPEIARVFGAETCLGELVRAELKPRYNLEFGNLDSPTANQRAGLILLFNVDRWLMALQGKGLELTDALSNNINQDTLRAQRLIPSLTVSTPSVTTSDVQQRLFSAAKVNADDGQAQKCLIM